MKPTKITRGLYDKTIKGKPQAEVMKVGSKSVKVKPEESDQRKMTHIVKGLK